MTTWMDQVRARIPAPPSTILPERYKNASGREIPRELSELRSATYNYLRDFRKVAPTGIGCLFVGRARKYKTYAACVILRVVNEAAGLETALCQCPVVFARLERNRFSAETDALIRKLCEVPLLCLDDFYEIPSNSFGATLLAEIAESRWASQHPTLWTGNIAGNAKQVVESIAARFSPNVGRRIYDGTEGYRVLLS